jgi:hypothetical protein
MGAAQALDPVLARLDAVFGGELVSDETVAEDRVVGMDLARGIDEVCVVPIALRDRVGAPLVEGLR